MYVFCLPDSKAIVDGNLKLILGLIWTLILHYSISMPVWEDEGDDDAKKQTPKQRLLGWIQNKIPYLPITNFNQNWQDGKALGALVDSCAPGESVALMVGVSLLALLVAASLFLWQEAHTAELEMGAGLSRKPKRPAVGSSKL